MQYRLITIERAEGFPDERRNRKSSDNIAALVRTAKLYGWVPGNRSGTGMTIIETVFESVAE